MAMKTKMMKNFKQSIKSKLGKTKRCEYCASEFTSTNEYLCHVSAHPNEIIPNLLIGTKENAKDMKLMNKIGISHVLYLTFCSSQDHDRDFDNFNELHFVGNKRVNIITHRNITKYFSDSFVFIDSALNDKKNQYKVLIFCEYGVSISPSFIIGYLMSRHHLSFNTSYNIIKSKRNIIDTTQYMKQLLQYQNKNCCVNDHKRWPIPTINKIKIVHHKQQHIGSKHRESFIGKRSIKMKSTNIYQEQLISKRDNDKYYAPSAKRLRRSYSAGYVPLDSHIVFTNI
eukprot:63485_1